MQNNLRKFVTIGVKVSVCVRVCERVRVCLCVMHYLIRTFARTRQFFCVDKYYYATENDPNLNSRQQLFSLLLSPPPPIKSTIACNFDGWCVVLSILV